MNSLESPNVVLNVLEGDATKGVDHVLSGVDVIAGSGGLHTSGVPLRPVVPEVLLIEASAVSKRIFLRLGVGVRVWVGIRIAIVVVVTIVVVSIVVIISMVAGHLLNLGSLDLTEDVVRFVVAKVIRVCCFVEDITKTVSL